MVSSNGPKGLFKYGEERSIVCCCTQEEKLNFLEFYSKWLLWKPAAAFQMVFYSINANTSCSFTKQELTVK